MNDYQKSNHTKWDNKYHIVWIPKFRRKALYGNIRLHLPDVLKDLAIRKECKIEEGHICIDHIHILISIPPKHSVAQIIGFIKGKSAIYIARNFSGIKRNFTGQNFWARGYCSSTIGRDEAMIREYIKNQEKEDKRLDQLRLL